MEELYKLDSVDIRESKEYVWRLQKRLNGARDLVLLGELVDYHFATSSKRALKVLTSLKSVHAQDFFEKLRECVHKRSTRLAVFRLLASTLNSQTSWLYKIVDHPLFKDVLYYLKTSNGVVVLTSALLVVAAILPLVPSYISSHLMDLFEIFTQLATIRQTTRLGLTPKELYLNLDVAVYYFFLQLYSMFPVNLFSYLRGRYGPTGEVEEFQEYIVPLFHQVQLHPSLVTDLHTYETSRAKWGSMEPHDIATLSLSMCLDPLIAVQEEEAVPAAGHGPQKDLQTPHGLLQENPLSTLEHAQQAAKMQAPFSAINPPGMDRIPGILVVGSPATSRTPEVGRKRCGSSIEEVGRKRSGSSSEEVGRKRSGSSIEEVGRKRSTSSIEAPSLSQLQVTVNPAGFKSSEELAQFWSPMAEFGGKTPKEFSRQSSQMSMISHSLHTSNFSSPISDSNSSSVQHTPGPATAPVFTFHKNYSPTASIDGESLLNRQLPSVSSVSQSAIPTPSHLEESYSSSQFDPMTQSLSHRSDAGSRGSSSPIKCSGGGASRSEGQLNQSLKVRFEKLIGMFSSRKQSGTMSRDSEEFSEISVTELESSGVGGDTEVGEECMGGTESNSSKFSQSDESRPEEEELGKLDEGEADCQEKERECKNQSASQEAVDGFQDDSVTPCVSEQQAVPQLGVYRDSRRFSHTGSMLQGGAGSRADMQGMHYSFSFPGEQSCIEPRSSRSRNANSETLATHTVLLVQEKLQRLVEDQSGSENSASVKDQNESHDEVRMHPHLRTLTSVDSTATLLASSPPQHGTEHPDVSRNSRLLMRRVSVCSRRRLSFSETRTETGEERAELATHPSPVAFLEQFITHGEMLHKGNIEDIPLTELEGVDWCFFGGCPHTEELGVMQSQVAFLHSQLLFERHQCLQHARRNRRLLSKARSATQLTEQLVSLRGQVHHQQAVIRSLQAEQQRMAVRQGSSRLEEKLKSENRALCAENTRLTDTNLRLTEAVERRTWENNSLAEELLQARERVFTLEKERDHLEPQLARARQLQMEVDGLTRELQVMGELYHQQREEALTLVSQGCKQQEWVALCSALRREKEAAESSIRGLQLELWAAQACVKELQSVLGRKDKEIASLHCKLSLVEGRCQEKIRATEEKYQSMKVIGQQLESHVMELRGRALLKRRLHRHKRSSSHTSGNTSLTPSFSASSSPSPSPLCPSN